MNFFFQAEDGIRDTSVTGVQTCALPISEGGDVIGGNEAVSRQDALRMMTSMAARFSFDEKNRGSIETGKLGDFVVLSDHFLTVSAEQLRAIRADLTVVGGRVAFQREK